MPQTTNTTHTRARMAGLFDNQASFYAAARPDYPPSLFSFLSSLTPLHHCAWDVGAGTGQASVALAEHYEKVVATDVSQQQLNLAPRRENITYICTPSPIPEDELHKVVGEEGSVDLVTVAQALHWFDLDLFYSQVKHVLKKPGGVFAAWCYTEPQVNSTVDAVFWEFYKETGPYWEPARLIVDDEYRSLHFPFESVLGDEKGTGPIQFQSTKEMGVEDFLTYLQSWSVLQCARKVGVELLDENRQNAFRTAWGKEVLSVTWPIFLRVGTPGSLD